MKQENKKEEKEIQWGKEILSCIIYFGVVLLIVYLILHFVGIRTRVSGSSMEATLSDGDNLIVDKISYRFSEPERFDVIIFPAEGDGGKYYIKRIIGLPKETVWIDETGTIFINGKELEENYGLEMILYPGDASVPIVLGEDEYFVLGDNRNNSTDSRYSIVGPVHRDDIIGRAWVRIYPFDQIGKIDHQ